MKQKCNRFIFLVAILFTGTISASAQIFVKVRPPFQVVVRTQQPNPSYIWVDEEWEPVGNSYRYTGGRWVAPPQNGYYRRAGYWRRNSNGLTWVKGNWYQKQKGNNGKHKGWHKNKNKRKN